MTISADSALRCTDCGGDFRDVGIRQYARITGTADADYNPVTGRFAWTGVTNQQWDDEEHEYYACGSCLKRLTPAQEAEIVFGEGMP